MIRDFGRGPRKNSRFTFYASRFTPSFLQARTFCPILPRSEQTEETAVLRGRERRMRRVDGLPAQPRQGRHGGVHQATGRCAGGAGSAAGNGFWREADCEVVEPAIEFDLPGLQCASGHQRGIGGDDFGGTGGGWGEVMSWRERSFYSRRPSPSPRPSPLGRGRKFFEL